MSNVRILAPTGTLGFVPAESLQAALDAGARVITPEDMRQMRQEIFMQHGLFKEAHTNTKPRKRRSIVVSSRNGRRR